MIAVLIGIIVLIVVIAAIVGIGFVFGVICGIYCAVDDLMDDPYLRVAALHALDQEGDAFYRARCKLHMIANERIYDNV